jgi:hypothetical protein
VGKERWDRGKGYSLKEERKGSTDTCGRREMGQGERLWPERRKKTGQQILVRKERWDRGKKG